jgi:hypothetical protein
MRYAVVIERPATGFSAYVPDLPGCIATGASIDEVLTPRFHGDAACAAIPGVCCVRTAAAGHYAAFQAGTGPLPSPAGDPSVDPAGFDRVAWQAEALQRIAGFLKGALR